MTFIRSYAVALPSLRLAASAYKVAWGRCSAKGLRRKPFCAFDEDPLTLSIEAAKGALLGVSEGAGKVGALFVGATTWPYEEKPAAASLVTAVLDGTAVRTTEIRGSRQAGLQALIAAHEYVASHPEKLAIAVATDAPSAAPDQQHEHALAAGAAAFIIAADHGIAKLGEDAAVTIETFGSRFRPHGEAHIQDLELRVNDDRKSLDALAAAVSINDVKYVATGAQTILAERASRHFGGTSDGLWPELGDVGAAGAAIALAHCLDEAVEGDRILVVALGGGATTLAVEALTNTCRDVGVPALLAGGREVEYLAYLKHKRMLTRQRSAT